jgi:hypothetical protein
MAQALWGAVGGASSPHMDRAGRSYPQTAPWSAPPTRAAYLARAPRT